MIKNFTLTYENFDNLVNFVTIHPHVISSQDYINSHRTISYLTFSTKEIYDYLTTKLSNGLYTHHLRMAFSSLNKCSEILSKLENQK